MRYTPAEREDLARRKEQWIRRSEKGEDPKRVRNELKLTLSLKTLPRLKQRYRNNGRKWQALLERRHGIATKGTPEVKAFVAKAKVKDPQATAAELVTQVWDRFEVEISLNRMNQLLRAAGLNNPVGRPKQNPADTRSVPKAMERDVDHAGAFFPSRGVERTRRARGRARPG
jgi:transposase